jgi:hypothetical protein
MAASKAAPTGGGGIGTPPALRRQPPGGAEVWRRRVARHVQQTALPLVQRASDEAVVRRAVIVAVARHCSRFRGE